MNRLARLLQAWVQARPVGVISAFAVISLVAGGFATQVHIDTSVERLLILGDPERDENHALKYEFSNDEILVAAFDLGAPFTAEDLRKLRWISDRIAAIDGVEEVLDLSTIEDVRGTADGIDASRLLDFESLDDRIEEIRAHVRDHRLYESNLVSPELDVLALLVVLEVRDLSRPADHLATRTALAVLREEAPPWKVYTSGYPVVEYEAGRIVQRDFAVLGGVALAAILLVMYIAARRIFALVLLGVLVVWTELVTAAWFGLMGVPFSTVTSAVPAILMATSATYAIYLLGLLQHVSDRPHPGSAVIEQITRPALLSGLSTIVGFLSLRFLEVQVIAELGTALAVGIAAAVCGSLLLLPALIHRFDLRLDPVRLQRLGRWSLAGVRLARRPGLTLGVSGLVVLALAPGILQITVDTDLLQYFRPASDIRRSNRFMIDRLSGVFVINAVLRTGVEDGALEPEVLRLADTIVREAKSTSIVDKTLSFLDYIYLMDAAVRPDEEPRTVLPTPELAAQYLLLYESGGDPEDYRHYINGDRSALNLFVRINRATSSQILGLVDRIRGLRTVAPEGTELDVLGSVYLFAKAMDGIPRGISRGILTAMALIVVVMALSLGSVKLALVAAIPNAMPLLVCGGLLGSLGIPLSIGTSLVACVALGLAVDDTAHVMGHVRPGRSLEETYRTVGRPVLLTTLSLGLGFMALTLSEFQTVVILGSATTLTLIVALLADLLVLPSLLVCLGYPLESRVEEPAVEGEAVCTAAHGGKAA